ncbi:DUF5302 domain-containing protein [Naasia lichenicola]|uniref:DUF5302 domain-containing protein n=1 Tax=Naasia lichenicola TaxID=2565933 RepID=A0A4V3WSM6_9MICO|nr:DUF5302 domain-containing protein [Naasia lichenicola]THG28697.1 hypothetical protein E6C64_18100 [Naasia lichenicola]
MSTETEGAAAEAAEETKRKFREALDRKNANAAKRGEAHLDGESAIHSTHGPSDHKREFRRKSG